ncbi:MAG: cupredoxin domain-containing protein [Armatimonadota bacterium]|nr:cupredoxin domain-containing protein [Armatimonadota bacterium]
MRCTVWLLIVALVGAGGCAGRAPQPAPTPTAGPPRVGGVITILMKDNFYEPSSVEITAGVAYEFVTPNQGTTVHNLVIQGVEGGDITSDIAVNPGQTSRFTVRIDRPGTYRMQCTYHPEMTGELRVVR